MIWLDFKQAVRDLITVDGDRQGIQAGIDRKIRLAVINLQSYIDRYRQHQETVYQEDDLAIEGEASNGFLPDGAKLRDCYYLQSDAPCRQQPLTEYSWNNRNDLICGNAAIFRGQYFITIDPYGSQFYIYPKVAAGNQVSLFWDGDKSDFQDADETPFDEATAECVAAYVKSWILREVDKDIALSAAADRDFKTARTGLYLDARDMARIRSTPDSPQQGASCSSCVQVDQTVEFVAFGDSGESDLSDFNEPSPAGQISHTADVATLVKSLRPDFILHLGDSNYPLGDPVTLQDYLTKFYYGWIPNDFYIAFGNHDQDTDGGAGLMTLLPAIASANGGKTYYTFTRGPLQFFCLNSGPTNAFDPDGETEVSIQGQWLTAAMAASSATWKIIVVHKAPYSSNVAYTPGQLEFRWGFKALGADLVLSGHGHDYERILVDGLQYLVAGTGGATKLGFGATVPGSQFRYSDKYGCLRITASSSRLQANFINTNREMVDGLILTK